VKNERIIIVGGPRRGKSTMAGMLSKNAHPHPGTSMLVERNPPAPIRCGDPLSKVKDPLPGVQYLPEGIPISGDDGAAQWVADNWFTLPGPWVCEGWVMARALRRWLAGCDARGVPYRDLQRPADRIIVLDRPGFGMPSKGQEAMHKAVMTVWNGIGHHFEAITEYA
jgi:hypothetical protein